MADGASSAEDSLDDDRDLSRTYAITGHRKHPDDDSDLGRTRTATGHKEAQFKPHCGTKGRTIGS